MAGDHAWIRALRRYTVRVLLVLLAMAALYILVLVSPAPLFAHRKLIDGFRIYSDQPLSTDLEAAIADAVERLEAMERGLGDETYDVFLCHSRRRYTFFAFLTRRSSSSQAIGLSAPGNLFVSMPRLEQLAANDGPVFEHSRFEGSLAAAIAHEIAHFHIIDSLGLPASRRLPPWKSEGWADFQANLAAIRGDPAYDLASRIDLLDDRRYWQDAGLRARRFYAWQLLVEYLAGQRSYRLDELSRPSVTEAEAWAQMQEWRRRPH